MTSVRKGIVALMLVAVALAFPVSALAATTADTTENGITGPAVTLSLVAPASITYVASGADWRADYLAAGTGLTNIQTNNTSGLTVKVKTDAFTGTLGAAVVPTTVREAAFQGDGVTMFAGAGVPVGGFLNSTTLKDAGSSSGPHGAVNLGFQFMAAQSAFTRVGATYTSALHFSVVANP